MGCFIPTKERGGGGISLYPAVRHWCETLRVGFSKMSSPHTQFLPLTFVPVLPVLLGNLSLIREDCRCPRLRSRFTAETSVFKCWTRLAAAFTFSTVSRWAAVENSRGNFLTDGGGGGFPPQWRRSQHEWGLVVAGPGALRSGCW